MNDFTAYCPYVNRPDLLERVIQACKADGIHLNVIDNSGEPCIPMTFSQSMNWEMRHAGLQGIKFCLHMHSDAVIPEGDITKLLEFARETDERTKKWAVIYTHYDILACYNPQAYLAVGGYDTNLPNYFSDNDWYRRCKLAGWELVQMVGHNVEHGVNGEGSQTINSDLRLKFLNGQTFPLYAEYYKKKWGGSPGHEVFRFPFNRPDLFGLG